MKSDVCEQFITIKIIFTLLKEMSINYNTLTFQGCNFMLQVSLILTGYTTIVSLCQTKKSKYQQQNFQMLLFFYYELMEKHVYIEKFNICWIKQSLEQG